MKLRDHPLMMYMGVRSWPPAWLWKDGTDSTYPRGEIGTLRDVMLSTTAPHSTCYLIMEHSGAEYLGALLLSDPAFQREIYKVLIQNCGEAIQDIGAIDLSYML
jgi:hypothetical protein